MTPYYKRIIQSLQSIGSLLRRLTNLNGQDNDDYVNSRASAAMMVRQAAQAIAFTRAANGNQAE